MRSNLFSATLIVAAICFIAGIFAGLKIGKTIWNNNSADRKVIKSEISQTTKDTTITKRVDLILPAKIKLQPIIRDTVSAEAETDSLYETDTIAKADTVLQDSSFIAVEYSYAHRKFKILADIKERIITNSIKETITITEKVEDRGVLYFQTGCGIVYTQEKITPGIYIGLGYSTRIF